MKVSSLNYRHCSFVSDWRRRAMERGTHTRYTDIRFRSWLSRIALLFVFPELKGQSELPSHVNDRPAFRILFSLP
jgi:hypothetical protein